MPNTIIEIPLRTSQAVSQHPFFSGVQAQTGRSSNVWQDDRGRIRRRPAVYKFGDTSFEGSFTGIFNYRFQAQSSSASSSQLLAFQDPLNATAAPHQTGAVFDLTEGEFGFPGTIGQVGTRIHLRTASSVINAGVEFTPFESCSLFDSATGNDGDDQGDVQILVDNLDYSTPGGDVIIRSDGVVSDIASSSKWRLLGNTSGANVLFDAISVAPPHKTIWQSGDSVPDWHAFSQPDFIQFGRNLLIVDNSYKNPLRLWTGGSSSAITLPQAPRGAFLSVHQNRILIGGLQRNPNEIVACGILNSGFPNMFDWDTFDIRAGGAVSFSVSADDQDAVTGMSRTFLGDLYVFKRKSLHRVVGTLYNDINAQLGAFPFSIQTISRTIGCGSHRTIEQVGNDLYWMSEKGVHSLQATQKYGDVEQAYLSFPLADLFENINKKRLDVSQALYMPRLGMYLLGIPQCDCPFMSKLLAYSVASKRWQVWDIGKFTAIGLGPPRGGETDSVYVSIVTDEDPDAPTTSLAILDFSSETDANYEFADGTDGLGSLTGISCVLEPGDLFVENPDIRYGKKSVERLQFYINSPGNFTSTVKWAWDGADEESAPLDLNPNADKAFGTLYALGANEKGNALGSRDDTQATSVRLRGQGHTLRFRVEDSNVGRFPYLHADAAIAGHGADYSPTTRDN